MVKIPSMNKMIVSNLAYRPLRSIISIFAVAIEVTLILLIVGLMLVILDDSKERQKGLGADVIVRPPGSANQAWLTSSEISRWENGSIVPVSPS